MKPIALLIQPGDSTTLPAVVFELDCIERKLKGAGYRVLRVASPNVSTITEYFNRADIRGRICLLHYAGHANGESLFFEGDEEDRAIYAQGFGEMVAAQQTLRLVFLNACMTEGQIEAYRSGDNQEAALIVTKDRISDEAAKLFADRFYTQFCDREYQDVRASFDYASSSMKGDHRAPEMTLDQVYRTIIDSNELREPTDWPWRLEESDQFYLADGFGVALKAAAESAPRFKPNGMLCYVAVLFSIAAISNLFAHVMFTSPAFQVAFSHSLDHDDLVDRLKEGDIQPKEAGFCNQWLSASNGLRLDRGYNGFWIETFRALLHLIIFYLVAIVLYNDQLPDEPHFWSIKWWATWPMMGVPLLVVGFAVPVILYHIYYAPAELAEHELWTFNHLVGGQTWELRKQEEVWRAAGKSWSDCGRIGRALALVEGGPDSGEEQLWNELYCFPYYSYLVYSLVTYCGIAAPMLWISVTGIIRQQQLTSLNAKAVKADVFRLTQLNHEESQQQIVDRVAQGFKDFTYLVSNYFLLVACVLAAAAYEALIGHKTLATLAAMLAFMSAAILIVIGILLVEAISTYNQTYEKVVRLDIVPATLLDKYAWQRIFQQPNLLALAGIMSVLIGTIVAYFTSQS